LIDIYPSELRDVRELSNILREKDRQEALNAGVEPHKALYHSFKQGIYRRTAFVDGMLAAMWGVAGVTLGLIGQPYLVTSKHVEDISPIKFARIYRQEVEEMKKFFPILENYVDASYNEAVRMLEIAGFKIDNPIELGPNKTLFYRFSIGR